MAAYLKVGTVTDFTAYEIRKFEVQGQAIDVVRLGDGRFVAFGDACPHWGVSLAEGYGYVNSLNVGCMFHDSTFDVESGAPVDGPAMEWLPMYQVRLEGDDVLVGWD